MTGLIRSHILSVGDALNRRLLEELYLEAAKRCSEVGGHAIGDRAFTRADFDLFTWEEYYGQFETGMRFRLPEHGYISAGSLKEIVHDDSYFEAVLHWTLDVQPRGGDDGSKLVVAWPVVDGQAVWGAHDLAMCDQLISYALQTPAAAAIDPADPDNEEGGDSISSQHNLTLGNSGIVTGLNGRSQVGMVIHSIGGFSIRKATMHLRKVTR